MSLFSPINLLFSVEPERVEFEMALSKQRKIDVERRVLQDKWTDQSSPGQYVFIARKYMYLSMAITTTTWYSSRRGSSREVSGITLTPSQSLRAGANPLDIFQCAANPN